MIDTKKFNKLIHKIEETAYSMDIDLSYSDLLDIYVRLFSNPTEENIIEELIKFREENVQVC